jgi:hypothetical protein
MGHHFISYSPVDGLDFVIRLRDALEAEVPAIDIWFDKVDLRPGSGWDGQLDKAIRGCESLLFVMTADSVEEQSICRDEWMRALRYK